MRFDSRTTPLVRRRAAAALLAALAASPAACGGDPHGPDVRVVIPQKSSFAQTTDSLTRSGVVGQRSFFRLYAKFTGKDRRVQPGTYLLKKGMSWGQVLAAITEGKGMIAQVTIPEGWALAQIEPQLAKKLGVPIDSVHAAVRDTALLHRLDVPTPTLEGYLFPSTYGFPPGTPARQAVGEMVRAFERQWKPEWTARLDTLLMSRHDVLTLASIVEREARRPEERPAIAAVYMNRLRKGMRLEADPTVQYVRGQHTARVTYQDLAIESPYNTYKHAGLPPGPIGSPGAPSIQAALYPANVPYLYFTATPDGHHEFRTTFAEHRKATQQIRRAAAAQGMTQIGTPLVPPNAKARPAAPAAKRAAPAAPARPR